MALIETSDKQDIFSINSVEQLIRILQQLICEENGASASYERIIECLEKSNSNFSFPSIVDRLKEILNDELQHTGSLIECITALDSNITKQYQKGGEGN